MNIHLSSANWPTKPGLYVMQEHSWEAPRMVRARFIQIAGDAEPTADLSIDDSRSHHYGSSPLNELRADGGRWEGFISPEAKFSTEITITTDAKEPEAIATDGL